MSANNSKPSAPPVIVLREEPPTFARYMLLMLPAILGSVVFHVVLVALFFLYGLAMGPASEGPAVVETTTTNVNAENAEKPNESFTVVDVDPAMTEMDQDIQFKNERIEEVSVPGTNNPTEMVGIKDGDKTAAPMNIPSPGGYDKGQGGGIETLGPGNTMSTAEGGGHSLRGLPLRASFDGRSGATRENSLREGGGTSESEAAVTKGLQWLIRQQLSDGRWTLGTAADSRPIAATALGLLPFLAAGKTHKPADKNPYDKNIEKALNYLKKSQDRKTGFFGGNMYDHGLATIAMCEAYGLSQDPNLRFSAQKGIDLIVASQSDVGSWDYGQAKSGRSDMSVSGWQIMALKSGQMAGLVVPSVAIERVKNFLRISCNSADDGYGYTPNSGSSYRMTAVGLLCRQYMENWGPSNPQMIKAVKGFIKSNPPDIKDCYYYYYATQVMHHFGGSDWKEWNEKMRDNLVKRQDTTKGSTFGSWSPDGDAWGGSGGRMMVTCLNLLTLEVYYRYLPLYYRDAGYSKDKAVQKAL